MGNAFFGAVHSSSHPCLEWEGFFCTGWYVCTCGHRTRTQVEHDSHVLTKHTQKEAIDLIPAKLYHKHYKTDEFLKRQEAAKQNRKNAQLLRKNGFKKIPKRSVYSLIGEWTKDGEFFSTKDALKKIK